MIHGADVTYPNRLYRMIVHPALRRAPLVIANSQATARAIAIGVRRERVSVRAPRGRGSADESAEQTGGSGQPAAAARHRRRSGHPGDPGTAGSAQGRRLVRGQRAAPPARQRDVSGRRRWPYGRRAPGAVADAGLEDRIHVLGAVDDADRERLLRGADIFVQPNIRVPGDMEGFGLVLLEAAMRGTPTVASGTEGILDAVVDGQTGSWFRPGTHTPGPNGCRTRHHAGRLAWHRSAVEQAARALHSEEQMSRELLGLLSAGHHSA